MTCFGYSWIFLDILGYFWIFLDILGYSWIFCVRARFCARDFVRARFCARATMGERPAKNQKIAKKYIYRYPIKKFLNRVSVDICLAIFWFLAGRSPMVARAQNSARTKSRAQNRARKIARTQNIQEYPRISKNIL